MRTAGAALPRFLVVGAGTAVASASAIALLVRAGVTPIAAATVVAIAGNVAGFVINRKWSFLASHERPLPQFVRYFVVASVAVVTSIALFSLLTELGGVHYVLASLIVSAFFAMANFLAHFYWSFAVHRPGRRPA